jgi:hypothetical protein
MNHDRMPAVGPGVCPIYPRGAWSRLPDVDLHDVWRIVGGNVDQHMQRMPLWKVCCLIYLEGLAHGSEAERAHERGEPLAEAHRPDEQEKAAAPKAQERPNASVASGIGHEAMFRLIEAVGYALAANEFEVGRDQLFAAYKEAKAIDPLEKILGHESERSGEAVQRPPGETEPNV